MEIYSTRFLQYQVDIVPLFWFVLFFKVAQNNFQYLYLDRSL